ncbi:HEAT repeat domain-containing protein [Georgenia sunbinii]|uniref:HEAT repeat domain-containing protein n=1 Tax=Georgenia sunbinii TaxID=3117728 RepID=UPI002F266832
MLIGEVSRRSGVSTRMLRHYDSLGLVRPTGRTSGGYREYSDEDIRRIFHVESLRTLGLSLSEVQRALDDPAFSPSALVGDLVAQTLRRLAREEELLARLRRVEAAGPTGWEDVLQTVMLLRALGSTDALERQQAVLSAASTASLPAEALAESVLAESETNVAGALRWALARTGRDALPAIAAGLGSSQPEVRRRAVETVTDVEGEEATALLLDALADLDDVVRSRAAVALGARGVSDAAPVLVDLVAAGIGDVEAAEALGRLAVHLAVAGEIVAALVGTSADAEPVVRRRVVQALAEIPGSAAREALETFSHDDDGAVALTARAVLRRRDP